MTWPQHGLTRFLATGNELREYCDRSLRLDLKAGFVVAMFAVPQAIAYAVLAGVPPIHGLYAAVVMSIVAALFGSSPYANSGPTNSAALLTAAATAPFATDERFLSIVFSFALLVGLIRLLMGLARMGSLVDYVPDSALLGFTMGAGILIAAGQLHHLFGLDQAPGGGLFAQFQYILERLDQTNPYALAIGLTVLAIMFVGEVTGPRFPAALVAISVAILATLVLGGSTSIATVQGTSPLPSQLPGFSWPFAAVDLWPALFPSALALAIVGLVEAVSIGETLAIKHGRSLDFNREFTGQGLAQIATSFFQGIPGSVSFSRSMLTELTGGQTRVAQIWVGFFTALVIVLVPGVLNLIPVAALSGILLFVGWKLLDVPKLRRVQAISRRDTIILLLTLITTVFVRIEWGILVGIVAGALVQIHNSGQLHLVELIPDGQGGFREEPYSKGSRHVDSSVVAVSATGQLFYGVSSRLRDELNKIIREQSPRHLILRVRRANSIDYSCWSAIFDVAAAFQSTGGKLYLCGVRPDFARITSLSHMREVIPDDQVFPARDGLFRSFKQCLDEIVEDDSEETLSKVSDPWKVRLGLLRERATLSQIAFGDLVTNDGGFP